MLLNMGFVIEFRDIRIVDRVSSMHACINIICVVVWCVMCNPPVTLNITLFANAICLAKNLLVLRIQANTQAGDGRDQDRQSPPEKPQVFAAAKHVQTCAFNSSASAP